MADARPPLTLTAHRAKGLRGNLRLPGDHAIVLRAIAIGATAIGRTVLNGLPASEAVDAMCTAVAVLGARVQRDGDLCTIDGVGVGGLLAPSAPVDLKGSRLALMLAIGLVAPLRFAVSFVGEAAGKPLPDELLAPLRHLGAGLDPSKTLTLRGPATPLPIAAYLTDQSAGIKSALLLAGLALPGLTRITEPAVSRDHTEVLLAHFGADIQSQIGADGLRTIGLRGQPDLRGQFIMVPGDTSYASFPILAGLLVPGSELVVENVLINPNRTGLIDTLLEMGGNIEFVNQRQSGGEFVADLRIRNSRLRGLTIQPDRTAILAHDFQALAVAAAFAEGKTTLLGLEQLRRRDAERVDALLAALRANKAEVEQSADSLSIGGADRMGGATLAIGQDQRLGMAMLVFGLVSKDAVTISDAGEIDAAFPGFTAQLLQAGASIESRGTKP